MKKALRSLFSFTLIAAVTGLSAQSRYLDDVFNRSDIKVTSDVIYGINFNEYAPPSIGGPQLLPLFCDVYEPDPALDTVTDRPVVIYFHTGSFLPKGLVSPMGEKTDSAAVEVCTRFAQKGYVAISATYRLGWLANSTNLDLRRGTNLLAVYLSIQDAKSAVRFVRKTEDQDGNPFGVDPEDIVLIGQGSGGYTVLAYASVDAYGEVANPTKFQYDQSGTGIYGQAVTAGDPYIDTGRVGDWDGYGALVTLTGNTTPLGLPEVDLMASGRNFINHPGYSNDVRMVLAMGGALGDSAWVEAGDAPMVAAHCRFDFYAPYYRGMVQVPVGGQFFPVVEVAGNHTAVKIANTLGNNANINASSFTDPISVKARNNVYNIGNQENILTFNIMPPNPALPFRVNSNPWDWWDPADTLGANETNPNIKSQSMSYIDTVMGFFVPRIAAELNAAGRDISIDENEAPQVSLYPNPVRNHINIDGPADMILENAVIRDISGKIVMAIEFKNGQNSIDVSALQNGAYLLELLTDKGAAVGKFVKE